MYARGAARAEGGGRGRVGRRDLHAPGPRPGHVDGTRRLRRATATRTPGRARSTVEPRHPPEPARGHGQQHDPQPLRQVPRARRRATITRHAVADYTGPQPMGSPCNTLGNEPPATAGCRPAASQLVRRRRAQLSATPQFWMNMNGPERLEGQRRPVRRPHLRVAGVSGCTGHGERRVRPAGLLPTWCGCSRRRSGTTITLQLYDPAFVATDDFCDGQPRPGTHRQRQLERLRDDRRQERYKKTRRPDSPTLLHRRPAWPTSAPGADRPRRSGSGSPRTPRTP